MGLMRISELAARSGVPSSTLRYYESEGLLPAERSPNGYRSYDHSALNRLAFIAQAKHLNLPLSAVRELVDVWESEPCSRVQATYRPLLTDRLNHVKGRITALNELKTTLGAALDQLDALPDRHESCDAGCAFLDRDQPLLPVTLTATSKPIVCSLDPDGYADRLTEWHTLLAGAERVEVDNGATFTLPIAKLSTAAALAAAEQACCAFLDFRLELRHTHVDLTITAPPEAAELLTGFLPSQESPR